MFLFRKNIILVPSDFDGYSLAKGLLSFDCYSDKTKCNLHCYNLNFEKPLFLGISVKNKLHKVEVSQKNCKNLCFELPEILTNQDEISCVLIDLHNDENITFSQDGKKPSLYDIVLWGSTQITSGWKTSLDLMLQDENFVGKHQTHDELNEDVAQKFNAQDENAELSILQASHNNSSLDIERFLENNKKYVEENFCSENNDKKSEQKNCNFETTQQDNQTQNSFADDFSPTENTYTDEQIEEIADKIIDRANEYENIVSLSRNSAEDESQKMQIKTEDDLFVEMPTENTTVSSTFFDRINHQIDYLFATNKKENVLNEIFPNSKFCKVNFDDDSGYYVFGVIYENSEPKYLCYGVPAKKDAEPPKELSNLYQWLPVDANNESSDGFYMMYQDAQTGNSISVDVI